MLIVTKWQGNMACIIKYFLFTLLKGILKQKIFVISLARP
jgi:hypothetical protein